jgi:hypothetical protein
VGWKNSYVLKLSFWLFAAGSFSSIFATSTLPSCSTASLQSYVGTTANPPATGGCAIGILDYFNVSYLPGSNAPAASAINVAPSGSGFSFGPVTAAPGQTVQFEIDYDIFIDPAPIITGSDLGLDPPTGSVTVTEYFCNDVSYIGSGLCLGSQPAQSLTVGTPVTGFPESASITFAKPATTSQEVGIVFTLIGGTGGASFDGLDTASIISGVPEPASVAGLLVGLLTLAGGYKLKRQRNR